MPSSSTRYLSWRATPEWLMAVAVLITAISGTLLQRVIMIAVSYATWHTARGLAAE